MKSDNRRRTDLAVEAHQLYNERTNALPGVSLTNTERHGFAVTTVHITDKAASVTLEKPCGKYVTIELDRLLRREEDAFRHGANALSDELRELMRLSKTDSVLVVGLGNRAITADSVGSEVIANVLSTAGLGEPFRQVYTLEAGVFGRTGIESARLVGAICREVTPSLVLVVDALASASCERLCRTVQLGDSGIVPGSGAARAREAINRETLGVPVIAIGVPTVVTAGTLAADIAERAGISEDSTPAIHRLGAGLVVTPTNIDGAVNDISKLIGYAINVALQGLNVDDITMLLG